MPTQLSRVTVVGTRKRADLALPSHAPVAEYIDQITRLCGPDGDSALPAAWTLAPTAGPPVPLERSLAEARVLDGQVLYLRDAIDDGIDDLVVDELDEVVAETAQRHRWAARPRGAAITLLGLAWLAGTAGYLARTAPDLGPAAAATALAGLALVLLGTAWMLTQRRTAAPPALVVLTSVTAIPCLAGAGAVIGGALFGPHWVWAGAVVGANLATIMALAATPEPVLFAIEAQLAVAGILTPLLMVSGAGPVGAAAGITVVAVALLAGARWLASMIVALASEPPRPGQEGAADVTRMLVRGSRLLAVVTAGPALAVVVAGAVLARSGQGFAVALAVAATVGLLARAAGAGLGPEVVVLLGAGVVGLFTDVLGVTAMAGAPGARVPALAVVGLAVLATGLYRTLRPASAPMPGADGELGAAPARRRLSDLLVGACDLLVVPLAIGVLGVYSVLLDLGRGWGS